MPDRRVDTGIVKRGDTYRFDVSLGYTPEGKQIRKTTTYTPPEGITERKADKLAREEYLEFKNKCKGMTSLNENMRFSDLVEKYFKVYAPNELKEVTAYNYRKQVDFHIMQRLGNIKLKDISTDMLSDFMCSLELSPASARKVFTILQSIFTYSVSQRLLKESPCSGVILPSGIYKATDKKFYMDEQQTKRFLELIQDYSEFNTILKILLYTGVRAGECLALQWSDIDFDNRMIHVRHNLADVGGKHFLTTPKTKSSVRYIFMSQNLYEILKEHQTEKEKQVKSMGKSFAYPEMVFTSAMGNYKDRSCLNTSFKRFLKGTEFDFLTLHSLRHCNATLLLNSGVDLKIVSEHLGHSDIGVTANIYADVLASSKMKVAEIIAGKLQ